MSSFEAVVDAVKEEGIALRQQLAAQAPEQDSPAERDARESATIKREEKTNDILDEILKSLGFGKKLEKDSGDKFSVLSTVFGFLVEGLAMSGIIAGIATLTNTDAIIKAFGLPKTFTNVVNALKLLKTIALLPFKLTIKVIDGISAGITGIVNLLTKLSDFKYTPPEWLTTKGFGTYLDDLFTKFKIGLTMAWDTGVSKLTPAGTFISNLYTKIKTGISSKITAGVTKLKAAGTFISDLFTTIKTGITKQIQGIATGTAKTGKLALETLNGIGTTFLTKIKEVFGTFTFGEDFKKTISGTFESIMKPIKAVIGVAGTADAPGKGLLGFLNGVKNLLPMDTIKKMGSFGFKALRAIVGPFVQFFISLFDFVSGAMGGADEADKEKVSQGEKIRLIVVRGVEGVFKGFGEIVDLLFVKLGGWIAEKLGFDKFAEFLKTIDVAANITKSFDYIFGIGQYKEKGGLPSDIGKLFAETIPKALQKGKDKLTAIGDSIANLITSVGDWFKENFSLENILAEYPKLAALAQKLGIIADPNEAKELEKRIKVADDQIAEIKEYAKSRGRELTGKEKRQIGLREDRREKLQAELDKLAKTPNANVGGITTKQGLVNIHPQEAIIPLEKMSEVINKINTAALSKTGGAAAPVVVNNVTNAPVDASSSSVTNAAAMPISPPTNYVAIL
jgi:predicted  nucleic acid-binding Zn-ribbon protein